MKKFSFIIGIVTVLFSLVSCNKEDSFTQNENDIITKSIPFEVIASTPDTKTTIDVDTWKMTWDENDILYAVTTDEEWGKPYEEDNKAATVAEFKFDGSKFSTTSEISDGTHTFNFLYTNGKSKSYHRGAATTYQLFSSQTMDANNPTKNIKNYDGLAGQVQVKTPTDFTNVSMKHLFTLMKVTLKNKTGKEINVKDFTFSASGSPSLAGVFNVTFGATPSIDINKSSSSSINVEITNGTIEAEKEMPVYFIMAPLENYNGEITFAVTDSDNNVYTKSNTISNLTFEAGAYNEASFTLKANQAKKSVTFDVGTEITSIFSATKDGIRFSYEKGESSTDPAFYSPFRWYKNSVVTINGGEAIIENVSFTFPTPTQSSNYTIGSDEMTVGAGKYSLSGSIGTWSGSSNKVTFTNTGNAGRFSSITVIYTGESSLTAESFTPDIAFTAESSSLEVGKTTKTTLSTNSPGKVSYSSENTNVATVDEKGIITAVGIGETVITASIEAFTSEFTKITSVSKSLTIAVTPASGNKTGTITFGSNNIKINGESVTGLDDLKNKWTITTVGTTSFTQNASYSQVGASSKPATSITFTTTLPTDVNIIEMSAKFGGFSGTKGTIKMNVGETTIGSGALNESNDVIITSSSEAKGKVLTVTVTDIAKGVKVYNIEYTYKEIN